MIECEEEFLALSFLRNTFDLTCTPEVVPRFVWISDSVDLGWGESEEKVDIESGGISPSMGGDLSTCSLVSWGSGGAQERWGTFTVATEEGMLGTSDECVIFKIIIAQPRELTAWEHLDAADPAPNYGRQCSLSEVHVLIRNPHRHHTP